MSTISSPAALPNKSNDAYSHMNGDSTVEVTDWCNRFQHVWTRSDALFDLLRCSDDFYQRPIKLRLPLLFYLGHLPCFAWTQFRHLDGVDHVIDTLFDKLFERGIDPDVQTGIVHHDHSSRHSNDMEAEDEYWRSFSVQSVLDYKQKVRSAILAVLTNGHLNFVDVATLNILNVALEHEMMHQETLMYLYAQIPIESLRVDSAMTSKVHRRQSTSALPENRWICLSGGQTSLGKPYNDNAESYSFGWDNEFSSEPTYVSSFELQSHPVRIGDFLQFVLDGAYTTRDWWDKEIFDWIQESNITGPASWTFDGSYRVNFILERDIPIESVLDHPVIVSQVEAKAYCRWLSKATEQIIDLPTEVEWIYAMWDWSTCIPNALANDDECNIDFRHLHTVPIVASVEKRLQWQGSALEWTSSVFRPFSGYRGSLPSYPGYSSDFFDDAHYVLLGGSFATNVQLIRRTFRDWFQNIYRYVFASFRCVKRSGHTDHPLTDVDRAAIVSTLSNVNHRTIPSQHFYDAHGSAIYEQITQLNEYYLFNQELKLLQQRAADIRATILKHSKIAGRSTLDVHLIELGCGDGSKVETWLSPWVQSKDDVSMAYHPVDISQHAIDSLVQRLEQTMGKSVVQQIVKPICSTFEQMYTELDTKSIGVQVVMLLGSTIGNFSSFDKNNVKYGVDSPVMQFVRSVRSNLKSGDWFLCGFDICKDINTMVDAYSDSKGITAAFNYNLLLRLNRELNFNFEISNYQHYALFNPLLRRMESWLISTKQQTVSDQHGFSMDLQPYEAIQTEISTKYTEEDIQLLMQKHSLKIIECYHIDDHHLPYALCMAQAI